MDALTPADLLQSLPTLTYIWSFLILMWGAVAGTMVYLLSNKTSAYRSAVLRQSDKYTLLLIALVNVFLVWYLTYTSHVTECTSWIIVVDVFYTAHLSCMSVGIVRWWNSLKRYRSDHAVCN